MVEHVSWYNILVYAPVANPQMPDHYRYPGVSESATVPSCMCSHGLGMWCAVQKLTTEVVITTRRRFRSGCGGWWRACSGGRWSRWSDGRRGGWSASCRNSYTSRKVVATCLFLGPMRHGHMSLYTKICWHFSSDLSLIRSLQNRKHHVKVSCFWDVTIENRSKTILSRDAKMVDFLCPSP